MGGGNAANTTSHGGGVVWYGVENRASSSMDTPVPDDGDRAPSQRRDGAAGSLDDTGELPGDGGVQQRLDQMEALAMLMRQVVRLYAKVARSADDEKVKTLSLGPVYRSVFDVSGEVEG